MTSIDAIINRQILKWELEKRKAEEQKQAEKAPAPIITISRQTGSRGSYFGSRLAQKLNYQRLHRELIDVICQSSGYYKRIVESLDDHARSALDALADGIITGQQVDHSDYVRYLCKVVISMSHLGGVIVMGRGANFILGPERGFHIRVVCPKKCRVENLLKFKEMNERDALKEIESSDASRRDFIHRVFKADIDDPTHYDLVLNTSLVDVEDLVDVTVLALNAKMNKMKNRGSESD
ncbi:MAG: cytidylate kinase-like family protein [Candidatus Zixiibacteriota bacterium]